MGLKKGPAESRAVSILQEEICACLLVDRKRCGCADTVKRSGNGCCSGACAGGQPNCIDHRDIYVRRTPGYLRGKIHGAAIAEGSSGHKDLGCAKGDIRIAWRDADGSQRSIRDGGFRCTNLSGEYC